MLNSWYFPTVNVFQRPWAPSSARQRRDLSFSHSCSQIRLFTVWAEWNLNFKNIKTFLSISERSKEAFSLSFHVHWTQQQLQRKAWWEKRRYVLRDFQMGKANNRICRGIPLPCRGSHNDKAWRLKHSLTSFLICRGSGRRIHPSRAWRREP